MAEIITVPELPESLQSHEMIDLMVAGLNAKASRIAPCLAADDPAPTVEMLAEAKLVLIGIVKRWVDAGTGGVTTRQQTAGVFSHSETVDTSRRQGWALWPSDIAQLQDLCKQDSGVRGKAFSVDVGPRCGANHQPWCSLVLGAAFCSCGADLTAGEYPLYEGGELS